MAMKYELTEIDGVEFWAIKIAEGPYTGVTYSYDTIKFSGETEDGEGILSFEYHIHDAAGNEPQDMKSEEFERTIGDILIVVLEESLDYMEEKKKNENNRTEDSSSTDL